MLFKIYRLRKKKTFTIHNIMHIEINKIINFLLKVTKYEC